MELVTPGIGLIFWTTLVFLLLVFLLAKLAWKPILNAVNSRETSIAEALEAARQARDELSLLEQRNEELLLEARRERDAMLKEAREIKDKIVSEAKSAAKFEAEQIIAQARENIEIEQARALAELKSEVVSLAIQVAEKLIRRELAKENAQTELATAMLSEIQSN
jgi:F-type H+-transporting ATPase subunit b